MDAEIQTSCEALGVFLNLKNQGLPCAVDRKEVVAHATLSALAHHWPSRTPPEIAPLLACTSEIKIIERSRWMTQRRIAIAKLAKWFDCQKDTT